MNPFQSFREYEEFIYNLPQRFPDIKSSSLVVIRRGRRVAIVQGEMFFDHGYRVAIKERLSCDHDEMCIEDYGYELWHHSQKIGWYDSQPHPNDPRLASSHPHHKHIPPQIKQNRIPAPQMSFSRPNLPVLIQEMEQLIKAKEIDSEK